jgi:hypothetical protein
MDIGSYLVRVKVNNDIIPLYQYLDLDLAYLDVALFRN